MEFRFLSPLLDLARGSIPSPVCDINRSLQPQGCPHLVLAARTAPSAGLGTRGRGVSAQPSRRNQFGRRARLISGLFETVPPPTARRRAKNSGQDALGCGRQQVFQDAGSCRGSFCSISGYLHPLKINWCESSALCPAGNGSGMGYRRGGRSCGPGTGPAHLWTSCLRPDFLQSTWE